MPFDTDGLTTSESAILAVCELGRTTPRLEFRRKWSLGRLDVTFLWRSKKNLWGRFGGGWNWQLGFEAGGSTIIFNLLVASLRLNWRDKK